MPSRGDGMRKIALANRSGMGAYAGAARRRVHLATVLPRPRSGHRPGRRQARHDHNSSDRPPSGHRLDRRQARHAQDFT